MTLLSCARSNACSAASLATRRVRTSSCRPWTRSTPAGTCSSRWALPVRDGVPPSVTWQAALPGHGAGRPRRPRGRRAASKRPRREGLPRSLAVACSPMRLLTPHTSTKQAGLPRGGISHALAYISLHLRVSLCISPHLPGGAASRRGQLAAARAPDRAGVQQPDAPRACLYLPISPCISVYLAIPPRRAAARCSSCSTW